MSKLLVKLGLKCSCGGWRTFFKRYTVHVADVKLGTESWEALNLRVRPCKECGLAVSHPKRIKLKHGGYMTTPPGSEVRTQTYF